METTEMLEFTTEKTNDQIHPWRIVIDGAEIAKCPTQAIASLIATTLENDNRHNIILAELDSMEK